MKLLIISHTEHYTSQTGAIVGWGPTVNEINHLAPHFESITHVAMLYHGVTPPSSRPYNSERISFVPLPPIGGKGILSKLNILIKMPKVLRIVRQELKHCDAFQLRTPTGISVFLIPYLTFFTKKKGWFKYAGNWNQSHPPLGYRLQRWFLKRQNRKVTINGKWPNQPEHCLTFENPCLIKQDVSDGAAVVASKTLGAKLNFCYVGRLETPKGVGRIIEAFTRLDVTQKKRIGDIHLVGDGAERHAFEQLAKGSALNFKFHGYLERDAVFKIYKKAHFFLMPTTASEGFPKVIAEASNFGCIPVVSSVSAIGQYVMDGKNGFVLISVDSEGMLEKLQQILNLTEDAYTEILNQTQDFVMAFTFEHYTQRILSELLS